MTRPPRKPTLPDVFAEAQRGRIYECSLQNDAWHVNGLTDIALDTIYIDPRPLIISILIHELLHRLRPTWSEGAVRKHTETLMKALSEDDKRRWWRAYRRLKKTHRPVTA